MKEIEILDQFLEDLEQISKKIRKMRIGDLTIVFNPVDDLDKARKKLIKNMKNIGIKKGWTNCVSRNIYRGVKLLRKMTILSQGDFYSDDDDALTAIKNIESIFRSLIKWIKDLKNVWIEKGL